MTVRHEPTAKRIRATLGGRVVADTTNASMVWEIPYYPTYYFPSSDVDHDAMAETGTSEPAAIGGQARVFDLVVDGTKALGAARVHDGGEIDALAGAVTFDWAAMDAWFEEDEQVYVHARDPHSRVDIVASNRQVDVSVNGVELASSSNGRFLFETGLPTRYYLPKTDIAMELLVDSSLHTECPYKGVASYYSVQTPDGIVENLAWWYPLPTHESSQVAGLVCFYNEKVDIAIDGTAIPRPESIFS